MIAAIYGRKSTEQSGVSEAEKSVTRQIDHARAYAERKGWTVDDRFIFVDDAISGAEFGERRPGLLRLMNALKPKPKFQVLVMSHQDRLGRDNQRTPVAICTLNDAGVRIFTYLDDQEIKSDSALNTFIMQTKALVGALEREQTSQRNADKSRAQFLAGHVTGGRVFGYDNVRLPEGQTVHRIKASEAAVVRRIFDLCVKGHGKIAIAKQLNDEHALCPRAQQGRPYGWTPSSVREILFRDQYRGVAVWGRTKKRNGRGEARRSDRPESEWLTRPAPELRIISDKIWQTAHDRLAQTRDSYLRLTGGRLWGRPTSGLAGKYLLAGKALCGCCGGTLEVRSRNHGQKRVHFYACSSYYRRGRSVCPNKLEVRLDVVDQAVLDAVEQELLTPAFVDMVVRKVLMRQQPIGPALDATRAKFTKELGDVQRELDRLVESLALTGGSSAVVTAIKARETRKAHLQNELAALEPHEALSMTEVGRLEDLARKKVMELRKVLRKHVPQGRQILAKLMAERLTFKPEMRGGQRGYRFTGRGTLMPLLSGIVPELSQSVASPTGFEPVFWP